MGILKHCYEGQMGLTALESNLTTLRKVKLCVSYSPTIITWGMYPRGISIESLKQTK